MNKLQTNLGLLFLRLSISGLMFFSHAIPKIQNYGKISQGFPDPLGIGNEFSLILAIIGEGLLSIMLALGFMTRFASFGLIITMLVIIFGVHYGDAWNKIEFPLLFLIPYIALAITGAGEFSVDKTLCKKAKCGFLGKFCS